MRESSIFIVIGVLSVILIGIAIFLIITERKVKKLESQMNDFQKSKKE